jgi:hypothetical protein
MRNIFANISAHQGIRLLPRPCSVGSMICWWPLPLPFPSFPFHISGANFSTNIDFFNRSNDVYGCWLTSLPAPAIHGVMRLDGFRTATELLLRNAKWQQPKAFVPSKKGRMSNQWQLVAICDIYEPCYLITLDWTTNCILKVPPYIYINL